MRSKEQSEIALDEPLAIAVSDITKGDDRCFHCGRLLYALWSSFATYPCAIIIVPFEKADEKANDSSCLRDLQGVVPSIGAASTREHMHHKGVPVA